MMTRGGGKHKHRNMGGIQSIFDAFKTYGTTKGRCVGQMGGMAVKDYVPWPGVSLKQIQLSRRKKRRRSKNFPDQSRSEKVRLQGEEISYMVYGRGNLFVLSGTIPISILKSRFALRNIHPPGMKQISPSRRPSDCIFQYRVFPLE